MHRKRGHNEGSIYQTENGGWRGAITVPGTGKRKYFTGHTKADVQAKLRAAQRDLDAGLPLVPELQAVEAYLLGWLDTMRPPRVKWRTYEQYKSDLTRHVIPRIGKTRLVRLSAQQLQRLYADLAAEGTLGSPSLRNIHREIHAALESAVRLGLLARNVADLVDAPRSQPHEMHPLSREEARCLLDAARGERLEALLVLALATGMRRSELLALHWRDLDLEGVQPSLSVRSRMLRFKGVFEFAEPKTRKSRRRIALSSPTVETLRRHHAAQLQERLALGQAWGSGQDLDLVFASPVGMPTGAWVFARMVNRCLARSGLPHIRVHDLRHTCATLLLGARVNPKVVSEMLGHASVAITLDIYSHVLPDMQQDAAAVMAQVLYGS